jgi:hypothetical protein
MQTITEPYGELKHAIVCSKDEDITCRIKNRRAYPTMLQMPLNEIY